MSFNAPLGDAYVKVSFDTSGLAAQSGQIKRSMSATLSGLSSQLKNWSSFFTRSFTLPIVGAFAAILKDVPEIKWAFSGVSDAVTRLTDVLRSAGIIDFFAGLIDYIRRFIDWLATLDPATLRVGTAILALIASIGPFLKILSIATKLVQGFGFALTFVARHPLIMVAVGIVALIDVMNTLAKTTETTTEFLLRLGAVLGGVVGQSIMYFYDNAKEATEGVTKFFKDMYDAVVGHSYVPDMAKETVSWFEWMGKGMKDAAGGAIDWVDNKMSGSDWYKKTQEQGKKAAAVGRASEMYKDIFGGVKVDIGKSGFGIMDSFKSSLTGWINKFLTEQLQKLMEKTLKPMFESLFTNIFSGIFGGGGGLTAEQSAAIAAGPKLPAFANGGRPSVGRVSLVGERGPELFVPDSAGTIIPNDALGGGANVTQIFNVSTGVSATVRQELRSMMPMIQSQTLKAVQEGTRRGGSFSKGVRGF